MKVCFGMIIHSELSLMQYTAVRLHGPPGTSNSFCCSPIWLPVKATKFPAGYLLKKFHACHKQ